MILVMRPANEEAQPRPRGRPSRGVRSAILAAVRTLIREQGMSSVTMTAVADLAGASEGSIHYHFGSKERLLEEAVLGALEPLAALREAEGGHLSAGSLSALAAALERAYGELIPMLVAVQSDPKLRDEIAPKLRAHDLGPHRAVSLVAGRIRASLADRPDRTVDDVEAAALLLVGACFLRAWERQMSTHRRRALPNLARAVEILVEAREADERL